MRTPGADIFLSTGYLFTEQIIQAKSDIIQIQHVSENEILVDLREDKKITLTNLDRDGYISSSCGICGRTTLGELKSTAPYIIRSNVPQYATHHIHAWPEKLRQAQKVFHTTGGIHAAAIIRDNQILHLAEDVGRHNALDKLIGYSVRELSLPLDNCAIIMSSRSSFELVQKALMAGIPILATIGAPTSLAIELAEENNITLIGFLKENRFNIYAGPGRIKTLAASSL
ncbi:UNVERIFIED_CONTAM: hypothetical protein GTU68_063030 [Idotea baltica]|nr:hypothetical protein [Idotea baltica]